MIQNGPVNVKLNCNHEGEAARHVEIAASRRRFAPNVLASYRVLERGTTPALSILRKTTESNIIIPLSIKSINLMYQRKPHV